LSVSPPPRLAVPREEDVRGRAQVVADGIRIPEGVVAAGGADDDRADAGVVCAANVVRGVADLDGSVRRPTARPFAGDPHEGAALLGVAAERALSQAKEALQAELLHAGSCHRLRVSGEEGQLNTRLRQPGERHGCLGRRSPTSRVGALEQLEVALCEERAPLVELLVDRAVGEALGAEHLARDPQARLTRVVDALYRVRGRVDGIELSQGG